MVSSLNSASSTTVSRATMPDRRIADFPEGTPCRYDLIGDVHGCAQTLEKLLIQMGYTQTDQGFTHPSRKTIFVGDIVDRGPRIRDALKIVRDMCDSGQAKCVMGNHEYYSIMYFTLVNDGGAVRYLRDHNAHHNRLIAETLEQFEAHQDEWEDTLRWFKSLPLIIETEKARVVHACWDEVLIGDFYQLHPDGCVGEEFIRISGNSRSFASEVFGRLTRGTAMRLPPGIVIQGRDGIERNQFRTRFWSQNPKVYRDVAFQPDPLPEYLIDTPLTSAERAGLVHYDESEKPVFIGHYWLQGTPKCLRPNVACLDYSAVKYGKLAAYRFDGESRLDDRKFQWVSVERADRL